jgi:hypothetical protein
MANRLLDISLCLGFSSFVVDFKSSDEISDRIWMKLLGFLRIDLGKFTIKESGFLCFFLFKFCS